MSIRLTNDLKAQAFEVARLYQPLREPLLVGSCVWLGEGNDIDVVVLVEDSTLSRGGDRCGQGGYGGMNAYRHGNINVIAVDNETAWNGWACAHRIMPGVPKEILEDKDTRVKICEAVRHYGELKWRFA